MLESKCIVESVYLLECTYEFNLQEEEKSE